MYEPGSAAPTRSSGVDVAPLAEPTELSVDRDQLLEQTVVVGIGRGVQFLESLTQRRALALQRELLQSRPHVLPVRDRALAVAAGPVPIVGRIFYVAGCR